MITDNKHYRLNEIILKSNVGGIYVWVCVYVYMYMSICVCTCAYVYVAFFLLSALLSVYTLYLTGITT